MINYLFLLIASSVNTLLLFNSYYALSIKKFIELACSLHNIFIHINTLRYRLFQIVNIDIVDLILKLILCGSNENS